MFELFKKMVIENPAITLVLTAALSGLFAFFIRSIPKLIAKTFLMQFTTIMEVESTTHAYQWIEMMLAAPDISGKIRSLSLRNLGWMYHTERCMPWFLTTGNGFHVLNFQGKTLFVNKSSKAQGKDVTNIIGIRSFGRSKNTIEAFVTEAHKRAMKMFDKKWVAVYMWHDKKWNPIKGAQPRNVDTIFFEKDLKQQIIDDVSVFLKSKEKYYKYGIPYRRGIFLVGPPGTGKSSIIMAIAGLFERSICVLNLGAIASDTELFDSVIKCPENAIVLIEDIDCALSQGISNDKEEGKKSSKISKAALLNVLDGVMTPEGQIFFMTSNFPEKIDDAVKRPGRADRVFTIGLAEGEQQKAMALAYYPDDSFIPVDFAVSPAILQQAFNMHADAAAAHEYLIVNKKQEHKAKEANTNKEDGFETIGDNQTAIQHNLAKEDSNHV